MGRDDLYQGMSEARAQRIYNYHTSWDWLMPVVDKIYQLDSNADFFGSINLEATYKEVVEFINEHNKYICGTCGDHVNELVFNEDTDVDECTTCSFR